MKFAAIARSGSRWYRADGTLHLNTRHAFGRGDPAVAVTPLDQEARDATPGWPGSRPSRLSPRQRRQARKLVGEVRRLAVEAMWTAAIIRCSGRESGWDGVTFARRVEVEL